MKNIRLQKLEKEMKFIERYIARNLSDKKGYIAIDIGANLGLYTEIFERNHLFCHAIEPIPDLHRYLSSVFTKRRVQVHNFALSNDARNKIITLSVPLNPKLPKRIALLDQFAFVSDESNQNRDFKIFSNLQVPCTTLDELITPNKFIKIIKIDVEGHELKILQGAREILAYSQPLIICEIESKHGGSFDETLRYLKGFNYEAFCFIEKSNSLVETRALSQGQLANQKNFIFISS